MCGFQVYLSNISAMAPDLLTIIVVSVSCIAFSIVILTLVVVLYRKDPLCCKFRPSRAEHYAGGPPQYPSSQSLIAHPEHHAAMIHRLHGPQRSSELFIIGKPNDYHMAGPPPRLPSYESVRKKDRQRQIHRMIAQRFGLGDCPTEPPPTYEETLRQSQDISHADLQSLDIQLSTQTQHQSSHLNGDISNQTPPSTELQGQPASHCQPHSTVFLSF